MENEMYGKVIAWDLTCRVHAIHERAVVPMS
jgi:hypothetical protein